MQFYIDIININVDLITVLIVNVVLYIFNC